jgi:aspartyl protease family protein
MTDQKPPLQQNTPPNNIQPEQKLGRGMLYIMWVLVLGGLTYGFNAWENKRHNPNSRESISASAEGGRSEGRRIVTLKSNRQHHYMASGRVNGKRVTFMLDTGATDVVVPQALANTLGLVAGFKSTAITANGTVQVRNTVIDTLELGAIKLTNIKASINPGMHGKEILLGMSALKHLEFSQSDDTLTLKQ